MLINLISSLNAISMRNQATFCGMQSQNARLNMIDGLNETSFNQAGSLLAADNRLMMQALLCDTFTKIADAELEALEKAEKKQTKAPKYC